MAAPRLELAVCLLALGLRLRLLARRYMADAAARGELLRATRLTAAFTFFMMRARLIFDLGEALYSNNRKWR